MSYRIEIYLSEEITEDNICFDATIMGKNDQTRFDYTVNFDLCETYERLLLEALNGTFEYKYIEKESGKQGLFKIDSNNYEENLDELIEFLRKFFKLTVIKTNLNK